MSDFDPYYEWLGIPPKDQPPHHYRLLSLDLYENNRTAIDAAANRLMAYLQELSNGEDAEMAQQILNEVSTARVCLLNQKRKAIYDRDLKATLKKKAAADKSAESPTPPPIPKPKAAQQAEVAEASEEVPDSSIAPQIISDPVRPGQQATVMQRTGRRATRAPAKKNEKKILVAVIGILLLVTVGLYALYQTRPTTQNSANDDTAAEDSGQTSAGKKPPAKQPLKPSEETIIGQAREVAVRAASNPEAKINEQTKGEIPEIVDVLIRPHWETIAKQNVARKTEIYQLAARHAIKLCKQGISLTAFERKYRKQQPGPVKTFEQQYQETCAAYREEHGKPFNAEVAKLLSPQKK